MKQEAGMTSERNEGCFRRHCPLVQQNANGRHVNFSFICYHEDCPRVSGHGNVSKGYSTSLWRFLHHSWVGNTTAWSTAQKWMYFINLLRAMIWRKILWTHFADHISCLASEKRIKRVVGNLLTISQGDEQEARQREPSWCSELQIDMNSGTVDVNSGTQCY